MKLLIKSYEPHMPAIELQVCHPSVPHQLALGCKSTRPSLLCPPTQNLPNIDLMESPASCPRSITTASQWVWALRLHYHLQMSHAVSWSFLQIILYLIPCFYYFRIHFFFLPMIIPLPPASLLLNKQSTPSYFFPIGLSSATSIIKSGISDIITLAISALRGITDTEWRPCKVLTYRSCFRHTYKYLVPPGYILFTLHTPRQIILLQPQFLCPAPVTHRHFVISHTDSLHSSTRCFARCFRAFTASRSLRCLITSLRPWNVFGRVSCCPAKASAGYTAWSHSQWVSSKCWHPLVSNATKNHLLLNDTWVPFLCIVHWGCVFRSEEGITSYALVLVLPIGSTPQKVGEGRKQIIQTSGLYYVLSL